VNISKRIKISFNAAALVVGIVVQHRQLFICPFPGLAIIFDLDSILP